MSIRIMVWNIQFFSQENFATATRSDSLAAAHLLDAVKVVEPHILVVVEVRSGESGGVGHLITPTKGAAGVRMLRNGLGPGWYVVPPQVLNAAKSPYQISKSKYFEGVAVFFQGGQTGPLDFIGPWVWTGNSPGNRSTPAANVRAYADPWSDALPATQPGGCGVGNCTQNQLAGQPFFYNQNNQVLQFPAGWARNPFYTAFWDKTSNPNRVIKLLSVHLPPQWTWSQLAMDVLGQVDLSPPIGNGDTQGVRVILGDFNVNAQNPNQNPKYRVGTLAGYTQLLQGTSSNATLIRRIKAARKGPPLYLDWRKVDRKIQVYQSLDNILVQYYGQGGGPAQNFQIKDWVEISKPTATRYPNAYMAKPLSTIGSDGEFITMFNYGKIRGTSDHLALVVDV